MISKALKIAASGLVLMALAGQAGASERIAVERNGLVRVALVGSAESVIVANPNIADVNVVDSHTIYIIGRGYGSSAVTILDHSGHPIFEGQVMVTAGQRNAVTMYRGSKPSIMDCSNVCQPAVEDSNGGSGQSASAAPPPGSTTTTTVFAATKTQTAQ